jgi:hypothetical protein
MVHLKIREWEGEMDASEELTTHTPDPLSFRMTQSVNGQREAANPVLMIFMAAPSSFFAMLI